MSKRMLLIFIPVVLLIFAGAAAAEDIRWISQDDLKALLDDPDTTIIDVRQGWDWKSSDAMIPGAVREDPMYVDGWAHKYAKDARLVFY
jgi:rhodanese-related sulfurtransferase